MISKGIIVPFFFENEQVKTVNYFYPSAERIWLRIRFAKWACDRPKTVRTPENIAAVAESVREAPSTSIQRRSQQLNISEISLRRSLHKDLGMTPYKVQLAHELVIQCDFASLSGTAIDLQKMPILAKKKSSFQMKLILILVGMYIHTYIHNWSLPPFSQNY